MFIVYPESAPANWREIISADHVPWVESPLHDRDTEEDKPGVLKKAHWHVIVFYSGSKSFDQIKTITDQLNAPIPKPVANARGMVRYLSHLDDPDKAQYSVSDIVAHCGVDLSDYLGLSASERANVIGEMVDFIDDNNVIEFCEFVTYCRIENPAWFRLLTETASYFIGKHIGSRRHRAQPRTRAGENYD